MTTRTQPARRWRRGASAATLALVTGLLAACSSGTPATAPPATPGPRSVYVALGNGETAGNGVPNRIRDAWPQRVFRDALPRRTVFANFGQSDVSVAEAMDSQLAPALALRPTVATVDLTEDTFLTRDVAAYETDLTTLVTQLQRGGRTLVVLGNVLPGDREPGVLACLPDPPADAGPCRIGPVDPQEAAATDAAFNAAIARVADRTGAPLADLHAAFLAERARGREDALWAGNTFSPNAAGHAVIARVFERAIRSARAADR
jgi:lysophospholipase L1-like esterase